MKYEHIIYEQGPVARIVLNRERYRNAQSRAMIEEMDHAFGAAAEDETVRVIILSGKGAHFSASHDFGTPEEIADQKRRGGVPDTVPGEYARLWELFVAATLRWRDIPKPTVAMVKGYCIFGGFMFASAMDVVFAAETALFLSNHTQYFPLPWDIGPRKAKEILFETRLLPAPEAHELGFVNRIYPEAELERETLAYAESVATNDPLLTRMVKFSVNNAEDAKGFSHSIRSAFNAYQIASVPRKRQPGASDEQRETRRLGGVSRHRNSLMMASQAGRRSCDHRPRTRRNRRRRGNVRGSRTVLRQALR